MNLLCLRPVPKNLRTVGPITETNKRPIYLNHETIHT